MDSAEVPYVKAHRVPLFAQALVSWAPLPTRIQMALAPHNMRTTLEWSGSLSSLYAIIWLSKPCLLMAKGSAPTANSVATTCS